MIKFCIMKKELLSKAATACSKAAFALRKRSPEILVTVGVIGTVASAVIACKATIKANDILAENPDPEEIVDIMNNIVRKDRLLRKMQLKEE